MHEVLRRGAPQCGYVEGMFSIEDIPEDLSPFASYFETEAACVHEAGHAVVGYAMGLGCTSVSITFNAFMDDGRLMVGIGGAARGAMRAGARDSASIKRGRPAGARAAGVRQAVFACAGPAAERRYRLEIGAPLRLLLASEGDHVDVDGIACTLEGRGIIPDGHDFRDDAWRDAQAWVDRPDIWTAINSLALALGDVAMWDGEPGTHTFTMPGCEARAIMRRAGEWTHG